MDTSFTKIGKGPQRPRRSELTGDERLTAISKALVYLRRHGAEREGITLGHQGFAPVEDLGKLRYPVRKMSAIVADLMNVADNQPADKRRIQSRRGESRLLVRT